MVSCRKDKTACCFCRFSSTFIKKQHCPLLDFNPCFFYSIFKWVILFHLTQYSVSIH